jgi:hypothetical protein
MSCNGRILSAESPNQCIHGIIYSTNDKNTVLKDLFYELNVIDAY